MALYPPSHPSSLQQCCSSLRFRSSESARHRWGFPYSSALLFTHRLPFLMSDLNEKEAGSTEPVKDTNQPGTPPGEPEKRKREYKDFGHEEEEATREYHVPVALKVAVEIDIPHRRQGGYVGNSIACGGSLRQGKGRPRDHRRGGCLQAPPMRRQRSDRRGGSTSSRAIRTE